jgi:hypothetical protein
LDLVAISFAPGAGKQFDGQLQTQQLDVRTTASETCNAVEARALEDTNHAVRHRHTS